MIDPALARLLIEAQARYSRTLDPLADGLRSWFKVGGTYYASTGSKSTLEVRAVDLSWSDANGADLARFLRAAEESVLPRSDHAYDTRSLAWPAIQIYYTGFYLVSGVLRGFGRALLYLNTEDCDRLSAIPGIQAPLERGIYACGVDLGAPATLRLHKQKFAGFHEGFWRYADLAFREIASEIADGCSYTRAMTEEAVQQAIISLEALRMAISDGGGGSRRIGWMAELRNDVNYRFARQTWNPSYRTRGVAIDRLRQDIVRVARGQLMEIGRGLNIDPDLRALINTVTGLYSAVRSAGLMQLSP